MYRPHNMSCSKGVRVLFGCANLLGTFTLSHREHKHLRDMVNIRHHWGSSKGSAIDNLKQKLQILNCPDWD